MDIIRVGSKSIPSSVAMILARIASNKGEVQTQTIGPGALNQAVKAVAIARDMMTPDGYDVYFWPEFLDVLIDDGERTSIIMTVKAVKKPQGEPCASSS